MPDAVLLQAWTVLAYLGGGVCNGLVRVCSAQDFKKHAMRRRGRNEAAGVTEGSVLIGLKAARHLRKQCQGFLHPAIGSVGRRGLGSTYCLAISAA